MKCGFPRTWVEEMLCYWLLLNWIGYPDVMVMNRGSCSSYFSLVNFYLKWSYHYNEVPCAFTQMFLTVNISLVSFSISIDTSIRDHLTVNPSSLNMDVYFPRISKLFCIATLWLLHSKLMLVWYWYLNCRLYLHFIDYSIIPVKIFWGELFRDLPEVMWCIQLLCHL